MAQQVVNGCQIEIHLARKFRVEGKHGRNEAS